MPPAGPQFYARVFHPAFNLDVDDATESVERFSHHLKAVDKGVQGLRGMFGSLRQARMGMRQCAFWKKNLLTPDFKSLPSISDYYRIPYSR